MKPQDKTAAGHGPGDPARRIEWWVALFLCVAASSLRLLFPGDTQWINDEPLFLERAAALRATGIWASQGLQGTVGLSYGPVAVWIYAALLRLSSDLLTVTLLRTALFGLLVCVGLLWLAASTTRLRPIFAVLLVLSPYSWLYSRQLWDNTWLIPLGTLALAAYVSFHQQRKRWKLWIVVLALTLAVLIHPMVAPLALAILAHALRFHRRFLRENQWTLCAQLLVVLLLFTPWLVSLWHQLLSVAAPPPPPPPPLLPPEEPRAPLWLPWIFPLLGGRLFSAQGLDYFLEGFPTASPFLCALAWLTAISHVLVWAGIGITIRRVRARWRSEMEPSDSRTPDSDFHLGLLCLVALAVQWLMQGLMQRHTHPHYYNGMWIGYAYFLWTALDGIRLRSVQACLGAALAFALLLLTAKMVLQIHRDGGNRGIHFGATLQNQLEIVHRLAAFHPDSPLRIEVKNFLMFPHALSILRKLTGTTGDPAGPQMPLRIHYRDLWADTGWLAVDPPGGP